MVTVLETPESGLGDHTLHKEVQWVILRFRVGQ